MGLGPAICWLIISRHESQLSAWADSKIGALFQFTLPIQSAIGSSTASLQRNCAGSPQPQTEVIEG
jgi:K+-sensing histidine kinase KdpD